MPSSCRILLVLMATLLLPSWSLAGTHAFVWNSGTGFQDIGTLGGANSVAYSVNASGAVTGYSYLANNTFHAFVWTSAGGMVDIGTLGGCCSEGFAIDSAGDVVGDSFDASGVDRAFFWSPTNGFVDLGGVAGFTYRATGVNDHGDVTGYRTDTGNGFVWNASSGFRVIPALPGSPVLTTSAINNHRQVSGSSPRSLSQTASIVWTLSTGTKPLPYPTGANSSVAYSDNDAGDVVGATIDNSTGHLQAYYWSPANRTMAQDLATLGGVSSQANDINNVGQIAGWALTSSGSEHAVLWPDHNSAPQDLGIPAGVTGSIAQSVNDSGTVVGYLLF